METLAHVVFFGSCVVFGWFLPDVAQYLYRKVRGS
jgi:hypothetical protein